MGSAASVSPYSEKPPWTSTVAVKTKYGTDKFNSLSDGMTRMSPTNVVRTRPGTKDSDAARWSRGFTSGRHVFEIVYPTTHRGRGSCVGVALKSSPLHTKARVGLGHNAESWGIDLKSKKARHNNKVFRRYPSVFKSLPDKFYMYLDVDTGTLQFGSDDAFYGIAISGISADSGPLYPVVSSSTQGSSISMVYRGQGVIVEGYLRKKRK